jgi:hypothetical protein
MAGLTSMALAGFAQSSAASGATTLGSPMTSARQDSHTAQVAKNALDRFLAFIGSVQSTSELTKENVGKGMGVVLVKSEGGDAYTSPAFAGGWSYGIQRLDSNEQMKTGVKFGFFNADESADPAPICAASLEKVRSSLISHGFVEATTHGEIGEVVASNFRKNDLVLTVTPYDLVGRPAEAQCIRVIRSTDGRK